MTKKVTIPSFILEQKRYDDEVLSRSNLRSMVGQIRSAETQDIEHCKRFLIEIRDLINKRLKGVT